MLKRRAKKGPDDGCDVSQLPLFFQPGDHTGTDATTTISTTSAAATGDTE